MIEFQVGYGKGLVEPGIAPLVRAVCDAGLRTFSSCEGHVDAQSPIPRYPSVAFYAGPDAALPVHEALIALRPDIKSHFYGAADRSE